MNKQMQFLKKIREQGQSAALHQETGDACPCITSDGYYDAQWHRDNSSAEDCAGKLIINVTATNTDIKALILPKADVDEQVKQKIGFRDEDDYLFMGPYKESDGSLLDVSGLHNDYDYITFQGNRYILRDVDSERIGDSIMYYYGIMKRIVNS